MFCVVLFDLFSSLPSFVFGDYLISFVCFAHTNEHTRIHFYIYTHTCRSYVWSWSGRRVVWSWSGELLVGTRDVCVVVVKSFRAVCRVVPFRFFLCRVAPSGDVPFLPVPWQFFPYRVICFLSLHVFAPPPKSTQTQNNTNGRLCLFSPVSVFPTISLATATPRPSSYLLELWLIPFLPVPCRLVSFRLFPCRDNFSCDVPFTCLSSFRAFAPAPKPQNRYTQAPTSPKHPHNPLNITPIP